MIYFYGGAFNPMTLAHLQIISKIEAEMSKDDTLIIGITNHNYKTYEFPFEIRKEIICKNLKDKNLNFTNFEKRIEIIEQNQRTWKFLTENQQICWRRPLTLVLGEDEFNDLISLNIWRFSKEILTTFAIKIFSRSEDTKNISATKVRELLNNNATFEELNKYISEITWNIIKKNK